MNATFTEKAFTFGDAGTLIGIVTAPVERPRASSTAFVFLNAGVVHRVGPNRMYVTAARRLAELGYLSVRFDLSGLGDSGSRRDNIPFDQASVLETREVMTTLEREYGVTTFVTAGLCSGAVLAFRTAVADERVIGSVLINPQGFVQAEEWKTYVATKTLARRYWREKLFSPRSWKQALTGRTQYRQLLNVLTTRVSSLLRRDETVTKIAGGLAAEFGQLHRRGIRLLLACSEGDYGVDYLSVILGPRFARRKDMDTLTLPRGDHSLTMAVSQRQFFDGLDRWARALPATSVAVASVAVHRPVTPSPARAPLS